MDPLTPDIAEVAPDDPRLAGLIDRHLTLMRASSPACSVHAMDADRLAEGGARMFAIFDGGGQGVAMGAVKPMGADEVELKSMHVAAEARGRGYARLLLDRLLDAARQGGALRASLETGSQDAFEPARALYRRAGFEDCAPFAGYTDDPNSVFLSRAL